MMRALTFVLVAGLGPAAQRQTREPVVLQSASNPLVSFRLVFHAGSAVDPRGKEGLAALTAAMLSRGGTEDLPLRAVMERLYPMAASVRAQADKQVTTFVGSVHRDHLEPFYAVFRDLLLRPRFDPEDFERNRNELSLYLTKTLRSSDDEELGKQALEWTLYTEHPYRHPVEGTVTGLASITLEDVKEFYRRHYTGSALQIGLAGDLPKGFLEKLERDFEKGLASGSLSPLALPAPRRVGEGKSLEVVIVEKRTDSTAISLGFPITVTRSDRDFYALLVANSYLGEHRTFNGVLMNELRGKRGLNYGDYSYVENFIQDGGSTFPAPNVPRRQQHFSIWIRPVAPENAHFALRGALFYLRRLVEKGMSPEAFQSTRSYLKSYSKLWVQSLDRRLGYHLDSVFYGGGFFIDEIDKRLDALTVEEVNRAVRQHLDRWDFQVVLVTASGSELAAAIRENRESPVKYQTGGAAPEVLAEDQEIERLTLPVGSVHVVSASELFER